MKIPTLEIFLLYELHCGIMTSKVKKHHAVVYGKKSTGKSSNFAFPNSLGTDRHWSEWICIWTGNSYKLSDLGEKDVEGLTALLTNGIKQTYDQYKLGLKKLAKLRL
jgi:hypothetical protein